MTTRQIVSDCSVGNLLLVAASQPSDVIRFSETRALSDGLLIFELMRTVDVHTMAMNLAMNTLIYVTVPAVFTVESPSGPLADIAGRTCDATQFLFSPMFHHLFRHLMRC
jgi:hypothetical protein